MEVSILERLRKITSEEQAILDGHTGIYRDIYMRDGGDTVNSSKLLSSGKLITIRPHTRFVHFPEHTHDYVEMVYMCQGETTHLVNGRPILLRQGDLLFLGQSARHEILEAGETDVAVNFIALPDLFTTTLSVIGEEETPLRRFLVDCLCGQSNGPGFLYFQVAQLRSVQNLVENLLLILIEDPQNKRKLSRMTTALLFLELLGHSETLITDDQSDAAIFKVLQYIETNYSSGSFSELADQLHYDVSWLSREIKRKTGKTYTQLLQEKRLAQAAFLLRNTDRNVADISVAVGYENLSYFHRIFMSFYGKSPKHYRDVR